MRRHGKHNGGLTGSPAASQAGSTDRRPDGCRTTPPSPYTVIGYVRVSTDDQANNGISLEEQKSRIKAYATAHGLELVRIASDKGVSGKTISRRRGLRGALQELDDAEAEGLVVCKLDRLSRTTTDILSLMERANKDGHV